MQKSNYIFELAQIAKQQRYCIQTVCTTCGMSEARNDLFMKTIESLGIDFKDTNMERGWLYIGNIYDEKLFKKVLERIIKELNDLSDQEIDTILGPAPFYTWKGSAGPDNYLKFVILQIYDSLLHRLQQRPKVMSFFKDSITNGKINYIIYKMDKRYRGASNYLDTF